jgi:transcriptional regulator with XRE-family HTH domain
MSNLHSDNLRYLLWKSGTKREDWVSQLANWAKCSKSRAEELLNGAVLEKKEQEQIAKITNVSEEAIQTERFVGEEVNILMENIKFLTSKAVTGEKQVDIARNIGVREVTMSRWVKGKQEPEESKLARLVAYLKLPPGTNLKNDPIFLSPAPVGDLSRRHWLKKQIDQLDSETLNEIFPALQRLLKRK